MIDKLDSAKQSNKLLAITYFSEKVRSIVIGNFISIHLSHLKKSTIKHLWVLEEITFPFDSFSQLIILRFRNFIFKSKLHFTATAENISEKSWNREVSIIDFSAGSFLASRGAWYLRKSDINRTAQTKRREKFHILFELDSLGSWWCNVLAPTVFSPFYP